MSSVSDNFQYSSVRIEGQQHLQKSQTEGPPRETESSAIVTIFKLYRVEAIIGWYVDKL